MGWHLTNDPSWVGHWVMQQVGGTYQPGSTAIGLSNDGLGLVAGVLYEQWNGRSIVAHIAVRGRMTPAFLAAIFHYPFIHCGAHKVICPIPSDNLRSAKLAKNMGFIEEARIQDASPMGDILIHTLTKADCRFLKGKYASRIAGCGTVP